MKQIVTHPDNVKLIEAMVRRADVGANDPLSFCFRIVANPNLPKYMPKARIRLPDGSVVDREKFSLPAGPVTYGPEDLTWLMWSGVISEQFEPAYYLVEEPIFPFFNRYEVPSFNPRHAIFYSSS